MQKQTSNVSTQPSRREFLKGGAVASIAGLATATAAGLHKNAAAKTVADGLPEAFSALKPLGARVHPIAADEYRGRLQHAQKLIAELEPKYNTLFVAPGTSLYYFTSIR